MRSTILEFVVFDLLGGFVVSHVSDPVRFDSEKCEVLSLL